VSRKKSGFSLLTHQTNFADKLIYFFVFLIGILMLNLVPFPTTEKHLISPLCFSTIIETESYRDVQGIYCGDSVALESAFEQSGPVWG